MFKTYTGGVFTNGNGRSYRVITITIGKRELSITFTKLHGNGDGGQKTNTPTYNPFVPDKPGQPETRADGSEMDD